jgi:hypothetical protein
MSNEKVKPEFSPILLGKVGLSPHDDHAVQAFPTLMSLLLPRYDDRKRLTREPGIITLRVDGSLYRITLVCPTDGYQTLLETDTVVEILEQLELHVTSGKATWVPTWDSKKRAGQQLRKLLDS